jgi:thioester reductase-like protein
MAANGVLITGATGFIGMEVLARFLERDDRPIYALVRARDDGEAERRLSATIRDFFGAEDTFPGRVRAIAADLERPGLGLDRMRREELAAAVTDIVHSAASVSFTLPLERSREINVDGTRRMLELAALCEQRGGLRRFAYVSTAYVAGLHAGEFGEQDLDVGQQFRNPYEQSKFEAELLVRGHAERLPIQIFRPSIVVGERTTGWTQSFNVLYAPMKAFVRGGLPALPARRSSLVDVVPVDYVADAVYELAHDPVDDLATYHLVAGARATTVGRVIATAAARLGRRAPVVLPPSLYTRVLYPVLVRRGSQRVRRGLARTKVLFPYFSMRVSYDDSLARARLEGAGITAPPLEDYLQQLIDYATRADWGRTPLTRAEASGGGTGSRARPPARARCSPRAAAHGRPIRAGASPARGGRSAQQRSRRRLKSPAVAAPSTSRTGR